MQFKVIRATEREDWGEGEETDEGRGKEDDE
jgi:hypothetical protein